MKNIIFIFFALFFGFNAQAFANINSEEHSTEVNKNSLCRTWYVAKAFETENDKPSKDRTDKAMGSTFVFNSDYSFSLTDNSKRDAKPTMGTWKETGDNSISITMQEVELKFNIVTLTKDSLYLLGDLKSKKMHLIFSSQKIESLNESIEKKETQTIRIPDLQKNKERQIEKSTESIRIPDLQQNKNKKLETSKKSDKIETEKKNLNNISKLNIKRENVIEVWQLKSVTVVYRGEVVTHKMPLIIDFKENNSFKINEEGIISKGTWELKDDVILLTMYGKTTTFNITKSTKKEMTFSKISSVSSFNLNYIRKY